MLYLFDFDGTLVFSYRDRPDKDYYAVEVLLGRPEQLADLVAAGHTIGIVTNQGGGAREIVTEADWARKIERALTALGLPAETPVAVSFIDVPAAARRRTALVAAARRKQAGAMIRERIAAHPQAAAAGVLYVSNQPEDQAGAQDAGVAVQWPLEFFGEPA